MKKKNYTKPTMEVVQLQKQGPIICASQRGRGRLNNYNWDGSEGDE